MNKTLIALVTGGLIGSGGTYLGLDQAPQAPNVITQTAQASTDSIIDETIKDFTLPALMGDDTEQNVKLSDYKEKWVLLFYYPEDGTTVCPTELRALLEYKEKFDEMGVEVLPVSTDSIASHKEWKPNLTDENFDFTWLSDTDGKLAQYLGIYDKDTGDAFRGTFLISPEGLLRGGMTYNNDIARDMTETLRMIEQTQSVAENGGVCPFGWEKGDDTIEAVPEYEIKGEEQ